MKSIESKMDNILNPAKKGGEHKVNRKQLVPGDGWELDENTGVLTISKDTSCPQYKDSAKSVVINSCVSYISSYSFCGYTNLTSVTFLGPLNIGYSAFQNCTSLTKITIPDGVITIHFDTFNNCTSLTSVTIPANVTSIENSAFSGCSGLTSVTYKGTKEPQHGTNVFTNCNKLKAVNVPANYKDSNFCGKPVKKTTQAKREPFLSLKLLMPSSTW